MEHKDCDKDNELDKECCHQTQEYGVRQTIDEMEFERGIWMAARDGDLERVQMLLAKGVSSNEEDSAGYKPLHYAARNGHYRVCEVLLDNGADVNAVTRSVRATALHRAAMQGHSEVVNTLLHHGADVNLKDVDGSTPLHRALTVMPLCQDVLQMLIIKTDLGICDDAGRSIEDLAMANCKDMLQSMKKVQKILENETNKLKQGESSKIKGSKTTEEAARTSKQ